MGKSKEIKIGEKFGKLTVIKEVEPNITPCGTKQRKFLCKCECGNEIITTMANLRNEYADCGCEKRYIRGKKRYYKGRLIESYLYTTYQGMIRRCSDHNFRQYKNYGERGICVCEEWENDFFSFYDWAIANGASEELTIDRVDNNGNYCPENCRWVDLITQANNTRHNHILNYNGESHTIKEWSRIVGCNESLIRHRLKYGKTIGQALGFEDMNYKCKPSSITYNGETHSIPEWSRITGIKSETIRCRLNDYGFKIGQALGYEPYEYKVGHKLLTYNGEALSPSEWSRRTGIPLRLITLRLSRGYSIEESLSTRRLKRTKTIIEYDNKNNFIREWNSAEEVAKFYNLSISAIHFNCRKNGTTRFGAKFRYKE